jgi:hypothetical protein
MKAMISAIVITIAIMCTNAGAGGGKIGSCHPQSGPAIPYGDKDSRYPSSYPFQSGRQSPTGQFKFDSSRYYGKQLYVPSPGYHFYSWPGYHDSFWGIDF